MTEIRSADILIEKPKGKRPLERSGHKWDNMKMDTKECGWYMWTGFTRFRIETGDRLL
jgi:hypothetical protein